MRLKEGIALPALVLGLGLAAVEAPAADLKPTTYSSLFSRAKVVVYGTVDGLSAGFFSDGRKATIEVEGLYKGRVRPREITISWKDEDHKETCYQAGSKVILFLVMRKDSTFAQAAPGVSCWQVENPALASGRPVKAVSYEFPLDLVNGIPKGAVRETEVVEKSLNFQVPKRKKWILVDALFPHMKPWKPPREKRKKKQPAR